jgi:hypothetical protein
LRRSLHILLKWQRLFVVIVAQQQNSSTVLHYRWDKK